MKISKEKKQNSSLLFLPLFCIKRVLNLKTPDVDQMRVVFWFDGSSHIGESSDVAVFDKHVYITDFKHHCVQVFNFEGWLNFFFKKLKFDYVCV